MPHPLYRHIEANNNANPSVFTPFTLAGQRLGRVHPDVATALKDCPPVATDADGLRLEDGEDADTDSRTRALKSILGFLIGKKQVARERFELFSVAPGFDAPHVALADRALMPALGFPAVGVHCNAYVKRKGEVYLWTARRAARSTTDPGKLDHLVAGGQPHGLSLRENLEKEAEEEAGIPARLMDAAKSAGVVRYNRAQAGGIRRDTLYVFDLRLPEDFRPENRDGAVSGFERMPLPEIRVLLEKNDVFKFNVPLVLIDFLIRRGVIAADEPGYAGLVYGLRKGAYQAF